MLSPFPLPHREVDVGLNSSYLFVRGWLSLNPVSAAVRRRDNAGMFFNHKETKNVSTGLRGRYQYSD